MRFRAGLVIGFATGFYAGTMAGRERYEQINRMLSRVKRSDTFDTASDKAKAVVDLGVERAKDLVETTLRRESPATDGAPASAPAGTPVGAPAAAPTGRTAPASESGTAANGQDRESGTGQPLP